MPGLRDQFYWLRLTKVHCGRHTHSKNKNKVVGFVRCALPGRDCCLHPSVMALTYCGEGQWTPDPGRRFRRLELSPGRDSARTVRARDRFMVCGAAHRTVRFQDMAAVNKSASLRDARRDVVAQADGLRLAARHHGVRGAAVGRRLPSESPATTRQRPELTSGPRE